MIHSKDLSEMVLRVSMALVFLYFGVSQAITPDSWVSFVPDFVVPSFMTANNLVIANAVFEITLGLFMILGIYTRFSSLFLSLHLFGIAFSIGFNPLGIRDFGLAFATLTVYLNEPDKYCLENKFTSNLTVT
jgi:uncharacterized membrane protein YphA (DoxX/SURF4 family)